MIKRRTTSLNMPSLIELCIQIIAVHASPRDVLDVLSRLPEELVMNLLERMVTTNTITDDRLTVFFTPCRRVLRLHNCTSIRNSIFRQISLHCPLLIQLDLSNCVQVNNMVVRSVLQGCERLQVLRLDGCRHITDVAFQPGRWVQPACRTLQTVSFARCAQLTSDLVCYLTIACPSLTDVNFSRCKRIHSMSIRHLMRSSRSLQRLNLSFMDVDDAPFTTDPSFIPSSLQAIDLTQAKITDASLWAFSQRCRSLEEVKLSHCIHLTDVGIEALVRSCPRLRVVDVNNCGLLTDCGIEMIGMYGKCIEYLNLSWCMNMTDKSIQIVLQYCPVLVELKLVWCTQLTDRILTTLMKMIASKKKKKKMILRLSGCSRMRIEVVTAIQATGQVEIIGL